jgi:rhamnose transport system substrate-binding protein
MKNETFPAGQMGIVEVDENGVVLLGDPTIFDKTNIDSYHF